ncbi:NUDIX hydrolase [Lysinibacillus sp. 2017]|uniref:NUDIX hydrolase n=1 Tax=unclassified Lysinibacillus TaxID=2636778 RepID=UPI000D527FCF|nr:MULTISPECIES: NUDIX hydrolase [unclassified Lysinibacillus]AWE08039.1 NUDIX hydrolase [Lysinibacillus sp. 2017]TGN36454.1 NUDIX domain-containing protein [Lysinibacillus sp. S2017]
MNLHDQIKLYKPFNEQEQKDRDLILRVMVTLSDVLTRNNEILHFTSSAFVLNPSRTHVLMVYHNIYNSWSWTGGHADGEPDLFEVAKKELMEETGVSEAKAIQQELISLDILPVIGHVKNGKYVAPHLHFNTTYLFEASDDAQFKAKLDENSAVGWIAIDEIHEKCTEPHMIPLYEKILEKVKQQQL